MVKSINEIGQFMGKKTSAEVTDVANAVTLGTDAIMQELRKPGYDYAQSYGIARPRALYYSKKAGEL